jgi:carotenoid cleavage dioxygenase
MIHGVRFGRDGASYTSRYVETSRYLQEAAAGKAVFGKIADLAGFSGLAMMLLNAARGWCGVIDRSKGEGNANTSLIYHAGRLLALQEADRPYGVRVLCDGVMETIGEATFNGKTVTPFTAHPKLHPGTGYLHAFSYGYEMFPKSDVTLHSVSPDGRLERSSEITGLGGPSMMHDFAITNDYAVFMDISYVFDPMLMMQGAKAGTGGFPFKFQKGKKMRIGLHRLDGDGPTRWFQLPTPSMVFHICNAWQDSEDSEVVKVIACRLDYFDMAAVNSNNMLRREEQPRVYEYTVNLQDGTSTEKPFGDGQLSDTILDFPKVSPAVVGMPSRFGYFGRFKNGNLVDACYKLDLLGGVEAGRLEMRPDTYAGEFVFVPNAKSAADDEPQREDDGHLVTFIQDEARGISSVAIYDATTLEEVAVLDLPGRVPYGFHALYMTDAEVKKQSA